MTVDREAILREWWGPDGPDGWTVATKAELLDLISRSVDAGYFEGVEYGANWKGEILPPHDKHQFADNICAYCVGFSEGKDAAYEDAARVVEGLTAHGASNLMYPTSPPRLACAAPGCYVGWPHDVDDPAAAIRALKGQP